MNVLFLDGTGEKNGTAKTVRSILTEELSSLSVNVEAPDLSLLNIAFCAGCFGCWTRSPGICKFDDDGRTVAMKAIQSDCLLYLTPVVFGGYSSQLKKAVDRFIPLVSPFFTKIEGEVHHPPRYEHYPRMAAVGILPAPDEESERVFSTLVSRNALNFHSPANAAGFAYPSQSEEEMRAAVKGVLQKAGITH